MLTDDDLTRELEAAFRAETAELRYAGRVPTPSSRVLPLTVVPVAAATAAVMVLPQLGDSTTDPAAPTSAWAATLSPSVSATTTASPSAAAGTASGDVELLGYTFTYDGPTDRPAVLHLTIGGEVPEDAEPVPLEGEGRAWIGVEAGTGQPAAWLRSPQEAEGRALRITSPDLDRAALLDFLGSGVPH